VAKAGQHHNDAVSGSKPRGHEKSRGNNHPDRSQPITTQSAKKSETIREEAAAHKNPHPKSTQSQSNDWNDDIREAPSIEGSTRARESSISSGRSGSDSNASRGNRGH
jgi:hypothetical protein